MNEWQELLQELMQAIQQVAQSGEVLSDEFQAVLAQTLSNLQERIEKSEQKDPNVNPALQQPTQTAPSNDARLLWILSGRNPETFSSYLQTFPTPSTTALVNNPQALNATIEQLTRMMPSGEHEQTVIDGIPHADLQSSNVWGAMYDQKTGKMKVRFQGGSEYEYEGVPQNIFRAFISGNASARTSGQNQYGRWWQNKNPSLGAALNQYIKEGGFRYRRIR